MTEFRWNDEKRELEIIDPRPLTYVPLSGNRCWAQIPTQLDGYCYCVNLPNGMRVLRRLGVYLQVGSKRGPIPAMLANLKTFYGANYLRLIGEAEDVRFEIMAYPDLDEGFLYITVAAENGGKGDRVVTVLVAGEFELHPAAWGCKGFTEDATQDYSGMGRRVAVPHDDRIGKEGPVFFVSDRRNPGVGFAAANDCPAWTLDRTKFSFETPMNGSRRERRDEGTIEWTREADSDDSFFAFQREFSLTPLQRMVTPVVVGYQAEKDAGAVQAALDDPAAAFDRMKRYYETPLVNGLKVRTPDPVINAQFNVFNVFMKMNEHRCGGKRGFLPAPHYYDWLCSDSTAATTGYIYANDWTSVLDGIGLFKRIQCADGFVPNLPIWREGPAWRERGELSLLDTFCYIMAACQAMKIVRDRVLAADYLESLKQAVACIQGHEKEGLIYPGGSHGFDALDWPCGFGNCPQTFMSVFAFRCMTDVADLAAWLDRKDDAADLRARADRLKRAINEKLWIEDRGYYRIGLATENVGKGDHDRALFERDMISWGSMLAVVWGVAEGDRAVRTIRNVKDRLFTPCGMKFLDPAWAPYYTDAVGTTYEAGRVQNGGIWQAWWGIESLVRAENLLGRSEEAFRDFLEVRMDRVYARAALKEKGRDHYFLRSGEWMDTDLTFAPVSFPYTITAAFFNQTLLESVLGIQIGYDEIRLVPHLPASWNGAGVSNLRIGDSTWTIEMAGTGHVQRMLLDGKAVKTIPIASGAHRVEVRLSMEGL